MPSQFPYGDQQQAQRREDRNYDELEQLRARNTELEHQLYAAECRYGDLGREYAKLEERADQAEQRITESQRQEPCGWQMFVNGAPTQNFARDKEEKSMMEEFWKGWASGRLVTFKEFYRSPIIPPTVEEAVKAERERLSCDGYLSATCTSRPNGPSTIHLHFNGANKAEIAYIKLISVAEEAIRARGEK